MGFPRDPQPVKLFFGFIYADAKTCAAAERVLSRRFGRFDAESAVFAFRHTGYYEREMGSRLYKKFVSVRRLIAPGRLSGVKNFTNTVETGFASSGRRSINIDPGYVDLAKVVLASTKDFVHRVYIGRKIFAEVTLFFQDKQYRPWKWTYPDFRQNRYREFLKDVRSIYAQQISSG